MPESLPEVLPPPRWWQGGLVGGWAGWLTAGGLRGLCQLMSIPSPGRRGEVTYVLQEEGAAAVTSDQ